MIALDLLTTCTGHLPSIGLKTTYIKNENVLTQHFIVPGHLTKCIYGRLEQRFKLALPANIDHRFCGTLFKTLQSKRSFISTSLAIFIFLAINISKWKTNGRFHKRSHHYYRVVLLFRDCRFCFQ